MNKSNNRALLFDILIIIVSIFVAVFLVKTGFLEKILTSTREWEYIGSFIAGIFFTSVFTVVPATITLGQIASANSVIITAILGGLGAVVGDLIIFRFVRDSISEHLKEVLKSKVIGESLKSVFEYKLFRWSVLLISFFVIASPLPDEIGISLLGFLKNKSKWFILISFLFNSLGILFIGLIASSL